MKRNALRFGLGISLVVGVTTASVATRGDVLIPQGRSRWVRLSSRVLHPANEYVGTFPQEAWQRPATIRLEGVPRSSPILSTDGSGMILTDLPGQIVWLTADGTVRSRTRLDRQPLREPLWGLDDRVHLVTDNAVSTIAPDGSVRSVLALPAASIGPAVFLGDRVPTVVLSSGELLALSANGDAIASRTRVIDRVSSLVRSPSPDGCLWLLHGDHAVCIDHQGRSHELTNVPTTDAAAAIGRDQLVLVRGQNVQIRSSSNAVLGAFPIRSQVSDLHSMGHGFAAAVLPEIAPQTSVRTGPTGLPPAPAEIWVFTTDGNVVARVQPTSRPEYTAILADNAGSWITFARNGEITMHSIDGTIRWTMSLGENITRAPVAHPLGGVVVPVSTGLVYLR